MRRGSSVGPPGRKESYPGCGFLQSTGLSFLQVGDPSLGTVPRDLWRGAGATGCSLCEDGPRPRCLPASFQVLADASAQAPRGLQPGALPCQVGPFPRRQVVLGGHSWRWHHHLPLSS